MQLTPVREPHDSSDHKGKRLCLGKLIRTQIIATQNVQREGLGTLVPFVVLEGSAEPSLSHLAPE